MDYPFGILFPMWFSFGLTVIGLIVSVLLARLAYGGMLFTFTIILTLGILVFSAHHLADLLLSEHLASEALELLASLLFLIAAIYLAQRLKKIVDGPA